MAQPDCLKLAELLARVLLLGGKRFGFIAAAPMWAFL
jgi:hypothetical protein